MLKQNIVVTLDDYLLSCDSGISGSGGGGSGNGSSCSGYDYSLL